MEPILDEIRATFDCGIWFPVVSSTLMLPDACGAVEFWGTNKRSRDRYIEWYDRWVLPHYISPNIPFDGAVVYIVRNAMLHETTGFTRGKHGFDRVVFVPPNRYQITLEFHLISNVAGIEETAFLVSIAGMMNAMERGVRNWLADVRGDPDTRRQEAVDKLIQSRPQGYPPQIVALPVVC